MKTLLSVVLACAALGQMTAPIAPPSARELHVRFIETVDPAAKQNILNELARTPPATLYDAEALYDLFMRFPDDPVRKATLDSLQLMSPGAVDIEPLLLRCLKDEEPDSVLFGLKGALRLRPAAALPLIKKIANRKFRYKAVTDAPLMTERNAWWAQYEALAVLAQWQGAEALPLIRRKTGEAGGVAQLLGLFFWKESLPQIVEWTEGSSKNKARAYQALAAATPTPSLRATREAMLKLLRDPKADGELRHQVAVKIGLSSIPEEVSSLLKEYETTADDYAKKLFAAAAFASRDPQILPLLTRFAKEDPQPLVRAGARVQLKDMLPPADYRPLIEWAARNDPDPQNRELADKEMKQ